MRDIRNETGILSENLRGLAGLGRTMTYTLTAPIVALGVTMANQASVFDANMRNINSIVGLTEQQFQDLSRQVLITSMDTRYGADGMSSALYEVFSAGYGLKDTADALRLVKEATILAESGLSDLKDTTNAMTATMLVFSAQGLEEARARDVWARMVQLGVGSLTDFMRNANKAMPLANVLGISFEDLGASAAFVSQAFGDGDKAMTALSQIYNNLLKPVKSLDAAYQRLGVTTGVELIEKFGSLKEALYALKEGAGSADEFFSYFNKSALSAATSIVGNMEKTDAVFAQFYENLDGAALTAWEQQMQSFAAQWDLFKSALQGVSVALGQQILPLITPLIQKVSQGLKWFASLNPEVHKTTVIIGGLAAAIGPVIWVLSSLLGTLSPIGLAFKAITVAGSLFASNFMGIKDTVLGAIQELEGVFGGLQGIFEDFYQELWPDKFFAPKKEDVVGEPLVLTQEDIITVDAPTSLYDIFVEKGYDKQMSWQEFMKKAKEGGWLGGAINPGDHITIDTGTFETKVLEADQRMDEFLTTKFVPAPLPEAGADSVLKPFNERFKIAVGNLITDMAPELKKIFDTVTAWADEHLGAGIAAVASLFEGSTFTAGNTPVYTAVKALLDGDIYAAIDAVIPGAGAKLRDLLGSDWGTKIKEAFPKITAALSDLLSNVGSWLENEGIPTLSRTAGLVLGKVAVAIGEGLGNLWDSLTSGEAASSVGNGVQQASKFLDKTVAQPFAAGWQEAVGEAGVENPIDKLFTSISGALVAGAAAFVIAPGFAKGVFSAITKAISLGIGAAEWFIPTAYKLLSKVFSTIGNLSGISGLLSGAGGKIIGALKSGMETVALKGMFLWDAVTAAIGGGIKTAVGAITPVTSWVASAGSTILGAIASAIAAAPVALGITLGALLWVVIPQEWKDAMHNAVKGIVDGIFGEGVTEKLNKSFEENVYGMISNIASALGNTDLALKFGKMAGTVEVQTDIIVLDGSGQEVGSIEELLVRYGQIESIRWNKEKGAREAYAEVQLPLDIAFMGRSYDGVDESYISDTIKTELDAVATNPEVAASAAAVATTVSNGMYDVVTFDEAGDAVYNSVDSSLTDISTMVQGYIGAGGTLSGTEMVTQFLTPLETAWNTMFAEGGTMATTFTTFKDRFATQITEMKNDIDSLTLKAQIKMPFFQSAMQGALGAILQSLWDVNFAISTVASGLDELANTGQDKAASAANSVPDGSHAMGLSRVPYDGYRAELHKGERVLTSAEAREYNMGKALTKGTNSGNIDNSSVVVNVYGVNDTDRLLKELERRGINLAKR